MAYIGITSTTDSEQLSPNYIGFQPTYQRPETSFVVDVFQGDGAQSIFPLSNPKPTTSRSVLVSVNGYMMVPVADYNLDSQLNLQFTVAPGSGSHIVVHHLIFPYNEATTAIRKLDDISSGFNGVTTRFTLTADGVAANILGQNVLVVSVNGVIQEPGVAYILNGDDIIFSEPPVLRSSFYAIDVGTTGIGTPGDSTITPVKFITTNSPRQGQVLTVDAHGNLEWTFVSGNIGAVNLNGLADVAVLSPSFGDTLRFNGVKFINAKLSYSDLVNKPLLSPVAISGSYTDLTNTPNIATDISNLTDLHSKLFDGNYNHLQNLPQIPKKFNQLDDIEITDPSANDIIVFNGQKWINDKLTIADLGIHDGTNNQVLTTDGNGHFSFKSIIAASGGFSGNYNDLINKPTINSTIDTNIIINATVSNPNFIFTDIIIDQISYRIIGDKKKITYRFGWNTANNGTGDYLIKLPAGVEFNTTTNHNLYTTDSLTNLSTVIPYLIPASGGIITFNGININILYVVPYDSTSFRVILDNRSFGGTPQPWSNNYNSVSNVRAFFAEFEIWN